MPAEIAGQRPLLERAAAGDREAFAQLYDAQVDGVYRYLLAWTGNRQQAADLTGQVFHTALGWLPSAPDGELGAWLIALAHDAVTGRPGPARSARVARLVGVAGAAGPAGGDGSRAASDDAVRAVARLGDPEREVVILRLLLGHSVAHTAHLSGFNQRAVLGLQLAACLTVSELTGAAGGVAGPEARTAASADEFERRLGPWEIDPTGSDPALATALAAASALRQAIPGCMAAPTPDLVAQLRQNLLTAGASNPPGIGAFPAEVLPAFPGHAEAPAPHAAPAVPADPAFLASPAAPAVAADPAFLASPPTRRPRATRRRASRTRSRAEAPGGGA